MIGKPVYVSGFLLSFSLCFATWIIPLWSQEHYTPIVKGGPEKLAMIGSFAPKSLISALPSLPAIAIVFPGCSLCSIETPILLRGVAFHQKAIVVAPGATAQDLKEVGALDPHLTVVSAPLSLKEDLGLPAAPVVFKVSGDGRISFVQKSYVPTRALGKVVDGVP